MSRAAAIRRAKERIVLEDASGCWLWPGAMSNGRNPVITSGSVFYQVRVLLFEEMRGRPVDGCTYRTCATTRCVNPRHAEDLRDRRLRREAAKSSWHPGIPARYAKSIHPEPMSGCWLCCTVRAGGYAGLGGRNRYAHRVVYELLVGRIPAGLHVHHRCHNRACCNPDHLELVRPSEHSAQHRREEAAQGRGWHAPEARALAIKNRNPHIYGTP